MDAMRGITAEQGLQLKNNGYLHLKNLIPEPVLHAALREINRVLGDQLDPRGRSRRTGELISPAEMIFTDGPLMDLLYKSPLWELAASLIGPRVERATQAQAVLRFPLSDPKNWKPGPHIDEYVPHDGNGGPVKISSFTLLACVLLSDALESECGNFLVYPGSHSAAQRAISRRGLNALTPGLPGKLRLKTPQPILSRAGDAVICHYLLAHDRQRNLSPHIRYAVFFRLRKAGHRQRQEQALREPWSEWASLPRA